MLNLSEWFASSERVPITLQPSGAAQAPQTFSIFCRIVGTGGWMTFLHGFPSCSWDWAKIEGALQPQYRLLLFDDSPQAVAWASQAGARTVLLGNAAAEAGADHCIASLAHLPEILHRLD